MSGQAWIEDLCHERVCLEVGGYTECIGTVLSDPEVECFYATNDQPTVLRAEDGTTGVLDKLDLSSELIVGNNYKACNEIAMATDVFGGTVHYYVCPQCYRLLEGR